MMLFTLTTTYSQVYHFKTTEFAYRIKDLQNNWTGWSDWETSDMLITFNTNNNIVTILSPATQVYNIIEYGDKYTDSKGGIQYVLKFIDQDYDYGIMRLRVDPSGVGQIYIDFLDISWVYNIIKL